MKQLVFSVLRACWRRLPSSATAYARRATRRGGPVAAQIEQSSGRVQPDLRCRPISDELRATQERFGAAGAR